MDQRKLLAPICKCSLVFPYFSLWFFIFEFHFPFIDQKQLIIKISKKNVWVLKLKKKDIVIIYSEI